MDWDYFWAKFKKPIIIIGIILIIAIAIIVYFTCFYEPPVEPEPEPDVITEIEVEIGGEEKYKEAANLFNKECTSYTVEKKVTALSDITTPYLSESYTVYKNEKVYREDNIFTNSTFSTVCTYSGNSTGYVYYKISEDYLKTLIDPSVYNLSWDEMYKGAESYHQVGVISDDDYVAIMSSYNSGILITTPLNSDETLLDATPIKFSKYNWVSDTDLTNFTYDSKTRTLSGHIIFDEINSAGAVINYDCLMTIYFEKGEIIKATSSYTVNDMLVEETLIPIDNESSLTAPDYIKCSETIEYDKEKCSMIYLMQVIAATINNTQTNDTTEEIVENSVVE